MSGGLAPADWADLNITSGSGSVVMTVQRGRGVRSASCCCRVVRRGADIATSAVSRVSAVAAAWSLVPRQPRSHDTKSAALDGQTDSGRRLAGHQLGPAWCRRRVRRPPRRRPCRGPGRASAAGAAAGMEAVRVVLASREELSPFTRHQPHITPSRSAPAPTNQAAYLVWQQPSGQPPAAS